MRVTDTLILQNKQNRLKKFRMNEDDENEPTQAYKEKNLEWWALNQNKSAFASSMDDGINSESVFDRKAIFRTKEGAE